MMKLLVTGLMAAFQAPAAPVVEVHEHVVITSVSQEPDIPSGILATAIRITGRTKSATNDYFIFFHGAGQPRPEVGATCSIAFERFDFQVHFVGAAKTAMGGRGVRSFECERSKSVDFQG
jgi:hypothetical protein